MGRINLSALRVRRRAIDSFNAKIEWRNRGFTPIWKDITGQIPPAQIGLRQQPIPQPMTQVRTRTLPGTNKIQQTASTVSTSHRRKSVKASRMYMPVEIKYEEDELRRQFFSDHPWELARPRIVLESTGDQYANADWSKGLLQPGIPLSGESVVQRQLWLLENTPDITVPESYDIARREFYTLRQAEETKRRIAIEEAEHMGAVFHKKANEWSLEIEDKMYDDWEIWSKSELMAQMTKGGAVAGQNLPTEEDALQETQQFEESSEPALGEPQRFVRGSSRRGPEFA